MFTRQRPDGGAAGTDIFISFSTRDTARVQLFCDAFRRVGRRVFWSNDIRTGSPDYQEIIRKKMSEAPVVVVVWTKNSVKSDPVKQECAQAIHDNKMFLQVVIDDHIAPMEFPMGLQFYAQKAHLIGWVGDIYHPEWVKLNDAIDEHLMQTPESAKWSSLVRRDNRSPLVRQGEWWVLPPDVEVHHDLTVQGSLRIDGGVVGGAVKAVEVVIGASGAVRGSVAAELIRIGGKVVGDVRAMTVTLESTGRVEGDILHMGLYIDQGAELDGRCRRLSNPRELQIDFD